MFIAAKSGFHPHPDPFPASGRGGVYITPFRILNHEICSRYIKSIVLLAAILLAPVAAGDAKQPELAGAATPDHGKIQEADAGSTPSEADELGQEATPGIEELELQTIKGDFTKTGRELMDEVYRHHRQYPYVYEEQTMIMMDRDGLRDTRKLHRYSRMEKDGGVHFMLVFTSPSEVKGVALLAYRKPTGMITKSVYLPAFGEHMIEGEMEGDESSFLGSDFSVENLTGEVLDNYFYVRRQDALIGGVNYFVVDVFRSQEEARGKKTLRRHFIMRDNFFITETDHYDQHGRMYKRQTNHDLKHLEGDLWRANMILMENLKDQHKTLIKIDKRIYSRDYVPSEIFTAEWLFENYPNRAPDEESENLQAGTDPDTVNVAAGDDTGESNP